MRLLPDKRLFTIVHGKKRGGPAYSPRNRCGMFLWCVCLCLILFILAPFPAGADLSVTLELDRSEATLEDSIRMVVKVDGARQSDSRPVVQGLESFIVTQGGTSSHVKIINGRIDAGINYTFHLQPQKAGSFQVGPAEVLFKGKTCKSNKATLKIVKSRQAAKADQRPPFPHRRTFFQGSLY